MRPSPTDTARIPTRTGRNRGSAGGALTPKAGQQGMIDRALAWSQPCSRDRASGRTRAQRRQGLGAAIDQAQLPLERIRAGHFTM